MLTPRRKGSDYHHGNLRESAILAGRNLVETNGIHSLGIRKIADQLRVTPASLYRHFSSLNELQAAIAAVVRNEIADLMISKRNKSRSQDPVELMHVIGAGYIEYAEQYPRLFEVAFLIYEGCEADQATDRSWNVLVEGVQKIRKQLPPGIEYVLWATVHGFATLVAQRAIPPAQIKGKKKQVLDGVIRLLR